MTVQPFMFFSDAVTSYTGLARLHRDLAIRTHRDLSSVYRVGCYGIGGPIASSSRFPFFNCSVTRLDKLIPLEIETVWEDFAGRYGDGIQEDSEEDLKERPGQIRKGIFFALINISWGQWLSQPYALGDGHPVRDFLLRRPPSVSLPHWNSIASSASPSYSPSLMSRLSDYPFRRWLYCPVDGHLPDGTLGHQLAPILQGFDRILSYTRYGADIIERTLEKWAGQSPVTTVGSIPNLPHGLDQTVFFPRDRVLARQSFFPRVSKGISKLPVKDDQILACMLATNSSRKTWDTAFATCAELLRRGVNIFFWGHTDTLSAPGHWNLPALARQFGMQQRVAITTDHLTDDDLAWCYSACDVMLATSSEGWGLPAMEALGTGLPVVGTTYAGSSEFTPPQLQVRPQSYSLESPFLLQRPIYDPSSVADKVQEALSMNLDRTRSLLDPKFEWDQCWEGWRKWLLQQGA